MSEHTPIEWTDSSWPVIAGCKEKSSGCAHCYAARLTATRLKNTAKYAGLAVIGRNGQPHFTGEYRFWRQHLDWPLRWTASRHIFVANMSDLFYEEIRDDEIAEVVGVGIAAVHLRGHTMQMLTKRADRMQSLLSSEEFWFKVNGYANRLIEERDPASSTWVVRASTYGPEKPPPGMWWGVSVEDQKSADELLPSLLKTPAFLRYVSYEPAIGPVNFRPFFYDFEVRWPGQCRCGHGHGFTRCPNYGSVATTCSHCSCPQFVRKGGEGIDWVICGGESGPLARAFDILWARSTIEQCRGAGVRCFVKQLGANPIEGERPFMDMTIGARRLSLRHSKGADPGEWSEDLRVQEMPLAEAA